MKTLLLLLSVVGLTTSGFSQPVITNQPQNQTAIAGATAMFTVGATGTPPLSYQWRSHANPTSFTNIPGATKAALLLTNVQPTQRRFGVVVTDAGGLSITSSLATLTVFFAPGITTQPSLQPVALSVVVVGGKAQFSVTASGTLPLHYQWRFNDTDLPSQSSSNLSLTNVSFSLAGNYSVVVTNAYGRVESKAVTLTVVADPFSRITNGAIVTDLTVTRGCAWGDYDADGFIDLFVANASLTGTNSFLYHNNQDGTFTRVTNGRVTSALGNARGGAWGDYDNDGHLDLAVVYLSGTNHLYRNQGGGNFIEVPNSAITADIGTSRSVSWADYDNDGYIDLFRTMGGGTVPTDAVNRLYHNQRDGTFVRVTNGPISTDTELNITPEFGAAVCLGATWGDYNNDGRNDLFVPIAHGHRSRLYRNDGNGVFTRADDSKFDTLESALGPSPRWVNGDWGDYDNDGDLDLFVSVESGGNTNGWPNVMLRNDAKAGFTIITTPPANDLENAGGASWGCKWGDYDNDGWLDLFVANANIAHNNFLYHNNGDGSFTKITASTVNLDGQTGWSCAWGDYDNDGFLDLFVATGFDNYEPNLLYHNNGNTNHWIKFRLIGTRSNRSAIGAKVRLHATINGRTFWQLREVPGGDGYMGQNDMRPNFGLGDATNADTVRIEWPSGMVQELHDIASNQILTITEPGGEPTLTATRVEGVVTLTLAGKQGSRYLIEQSAALPNWQSGNLIVSPTNVNGAVSFPAIPDATRFYRAVLQ